MNNRRFALLLLLAVVVPLSLLALLAVLFPHEVWDDFIYRYFWGPVISDSEEQTVNGVAEGYNIISTVTYGILLGLAFFLLYLIAKRSRLQVDVRFIFASVPLILFGGVARAMEDAQLFHGWLRYLFISPLIYVLVALLFFLAVAFGIYIERKQKKASLNKRSLVHAILIALIVGSYFIIVSFWPEALSATLPPALPLLFAAISVLVFRYWLKNGLAPATASVASVGLLVLAMAASYALLFTQDQGWQQYYLTSTGSPLVPHPVEFFIIPCIALVLTFLVFILGKALKKGSMAVIAMPLSLLLFLAQFLDGAATYRGIETYGYLEKHVLPTALIGLTGTAAVMLPLKFLMVLVIILILDILFKNDLAKYPNLSNIIKFGVIFLGMAPGTRDTIRIALGV